MKKVSVIINSVDNDSGQLKEAIASYAQQSKEDIEVEIIVSTIDGDPAIEIAKKMGCIVVTAKKPGIFEQINRAVKKVTGDYVCYASGNDVALPDKLLMEVTALETEKKLVCFSSFFKTDENLDNRKLALFHAYDYKKHLTGNFVSDCSMMTRDVLDKYAPFNPKFKNHAYYDFWLRVAEGEGRNMFVYNPQPTWLYRQSSNSSHLLRKKDPKKVEENNLNRQKMLATHGV